MPELTLLVLDLGLDVLNGVGGLHLERDGLTLQEGNEDKRSRPQLW